MTSRTTVCPPVLLDLYMKRSSLSSLIRRQRRSFCRQSSSLQRSISLSYGVREIRGLQGDERTRGGSPQSHDIDRSKMTYRSGTLLLCRKRILRMAKRYNRYPQHGPHALQGIHRKTRGYSGYRYTVRAKGFLSIQGCALEFSGGSQKTYLIAGVADGTGNKVSGTEFSKDALFGKLSSFWIIHTRIGTWSGANARRTYT